ncbi:hypothetical protein SKAU_G00209470 [Synaphobranchus kaupii]|uniref:Myb/SANT-like DNA-binding domain-containing protein n=1 Tax=Synaphobranchus kaupii TaxID=118154 RepID=A0A9Q1F8Q8_SYNKA|nr:hypothetical protein SKAU_G00209470 [Synaphobranchus kaupii]
MSNWSDSEIVELLIIRAEEEICRNLSGTVKDAVVYDKITTSLGARGIQRQKTQVISKLKYLRRQFLKMNDYHNTSGNDRVNWPYFQMCQAIWGNSHSARPVAITGSLTLNNVNEVEETPQSCPTLTSDANDANTNSTSRDGVDETGEDTEESAAERTIQPPRKKAKKSSKMDLISKSINTLVANMEKDRDQDNLRIQEQREYEESLRREAKVEEREERVMQMAMWKSMQESQTNMFRELLNRLPLPTPPQPFYPPFQQNQGPPPGCNTYSMQPYTPIQS